MKIVYVSDPIEKGCWRLNTPFHLKAAKASDKSIADYFVIIAHRVVPSKSARFTSIKIVRAAFCIHEFLQLRASGIANIVRIEDEYVRYKSIGNHPDAGDVEMDFVQKWRDYIRLRPELIEFAITEKTSLLCYEEEY